MAVQEEEIRQVMALFEDEYQHEWDETQPEGAKRNKKILNECGVKWPPEHAKTT